MRRKSGPGVQERFRASREQRQAQRIEKLHSSAAERRHWAQKDAEKGRGPAAGGGGMA